MERLFCNSQVRLRSSSWVGGCNSFQNILLIGFFGLALLRCWRLCLLEAQLTQLLPLPTVGPRLLDFPGSENSVCLPLSSFLSPDNCRLQCLPRETKNPYRWILSLNFTGRHDQTTTRSDQGTLCDLLLSLMAQEWIFRVHRGLISRTDGSAVFTTNNGLPP